MFPTHFELNPKAVITGLAIPDKRRLLDFVAARAAEVYDIPADSARKAIEDRESLGSTGVGGGIATPHGRMPIVHRPVALLIRLDPPIDYDAVDGAVVDIVFALLSPEHSGAIHLHALAEISRMLRDDKMQAKLRGAVDADALFAVVTGGNERNAA